MKMSVMCSWFHIFLNSDYSHIQIMFTHKPVLHLNCVHCCCFLFSNIRNATRQGAPWNMHNIPNFTRQGAPWNMHALSDTFSFFIMSEHMLTQVTHFICAHLSAFKPALSPLKIQPVKSHTCTCSKCNSPLCGDNSKNELGKCIE
jgi:hypothetical protein